MKLTFYGAAGEVTGSQHLVETDAHRVLLDCGLFQGRRAETYFRNAHFYCDPRNLDGIFLSHAHIDHAGNLPGIVRAGFRGPIYCTAATADIAYVMLRDSAEIQAEDAAYLTRQHDQGTPPVPPLYTRDDVGKVARQFETLEEEVWHELSPNLSVRLRNAGHILGSSLIELDLEDGGDRLRLVFSGDLGRRGMSLLRDPAIVDRCDVLLCESTYGNRLHPSLADLKAALWEILRDAVAQRGKVIIPAFSLGRTQQVISLLKELLESGEFPPLPVYVDSPLATSLTELYRSHSEHFDEQAQMLAAGDDDPFSFETLHYVRDHRDSMALNDRAGPLVIIAAGGMCENGRVRHHLKHAIDQKRNTVCLIGYQAPHTLGRRIVERPPTVPIFGRQIPLAARVARLEGLSAHADSEDLCWWISRIAARGGVGTCFLVHGEDEATAGLANLIQNDCDEAPILPQWGESFEINPPIFPV